MRFFGKWKQRWPWIFGGLFIVAWLIDPIVKLNIENWAENHSLDNVLVEGEKQSGDFMTWVTEVAYNILSVITGALSSEVFLAFVIGSTIFAFWDPLERYGKRLLSLRKNHPLTFYAPQLPDTEAVSCDAKKDEHVYKNTYTVSVQNTHPKTLTIRNLQLNAAIMGTPERLPFQDESYGSIDLAPGAVATFVIGHLYSENSLGLVKGFQKVKKSDFDMLSSSARFPSMKIPFERGSTGFGLHYPEVQKSNLTHAELPLRLWFTADDTEPLFVRLVMQPDDEKKVVFEVSADS